MKETKDMMALEKLRDGVAKIRGQLAAAREQRAAHPDPAIRARVAKLREDEEVAVDQLALAEAEAATAEAQRAEAERIEAASRRAAQVQATLDRHEALATDVLKAAKALRGAVAALVDHTKGLQQTEGLDSYHLQGVLTRAGLAVTNTWPAHVSLLSARTTHGWEDGWPAQERADLADRIKAA